MLLLPSTSGIHEYSPSEELKKRSPLTRSAFSTPVTRNTSAYDSHIPIIHPPERALSEYIPRVHDHTVRFREPELDAMSEDGRSIANSETSGTTAEGRKRRRSIRTSSTFHLAHPAPTLTQKQRLLHIRPKLLLQLQRLSADSRPKPAIDVLPSTVVVPRLVKKFPRIFRGKAELGANDVMVVRSEAYDIEDGHQAEGNESDEESLSNRELHAVICQARKDCGGSVGRAEIVLDDGTLWSATPNSNGLFEFVSIDEHGIKTTARWVRRNSKRRSVDFSEILENQIESKFTFSIIDPSRRQHPVMATLQSNKLDIPDFYTSISSSSGKYPPPSPIRMNSGFSAVSEPTPENELQLERQTIMIDEKLKILIQVTGIWVALRLGWSPYFKYNDAMTLPSSSSRSRLTSGTRVRSLSISPDGEVTAPVPRTITPEPTQSTLAGVGEKIRRNCPAASTTSPVEKSYIPPKRAVSTGSAFMQRALARRAGNPPSTVLSESESDGLATPPKRATTGDFSPTYTGTPPPTLDTGSPATTLDTPTKPQRRVQSVYIPASSTLHNGNVRPERPYSVLLDHPPSNLDTKQKESRWKSFTKFFRRGPKG